MSVVGARRTWVWIELHQLTVSGKNVPLLARPLAPSIYDNLSSAFFCVSRTVFSPRESSARQSSALCFVYQRGVPSRLIVNLQHSAPNTTLTRIIRDATEVW